MAIEIFNTLTGKKELFKPIRKNAVGMYVCGPTVYDSPHVGHLRSAYVFDFIRRYFLYSGYRVKFVKNITDIDDKIIDKARKDNKNQDLKKEVKDVANKYLDEYRKAMEEFGILAPDIEPKATRHIAKMLKVIRALIRKGFAYESDGSVYFKVREFKNYGGLSGQSIEKLKSGARVELNEKKNDPLDFALWKKALENEPSWKTPWGLGRPGWHIECSVMSMNYLGKTFDIHGGGKDLIFPHHENEIVQAEAFTGRRFANCWMHNGILTINGEKMSKSLGNFISVSEILSRYHPEVLKFFFLSAHYSHPLDFTYERMEEAKRARDKFYILFDKTDQDLKKKRAVISPELDNFRKQFSESMDDDFNTPKALAVLFELVNFANRHPKDKDIYSGAVRLILDLGKVLGIFERKDKDIKIKLPEGLDSAKISTLIDKRNEFRKNKDFVQADKIRNELEGLGVTLEDEAGKTKWHFR